MQRESFHFPWQQLRMDVLLCGADDADTSSLTLEETSILSSATDEGLDMSQRLTESIFIGPDIDAEGEEIVTGTALICSPPPPTTTTTLSSA